MKFIITFFLLVSLSISEARAQNSYIQSTFLGYASGGSNGNLYLDDVGNAYMIINSRYDINFHGEVYPSHGSSDYSVIGKFDSSGKFLWSRTLSKSLNDLSSDIIYDLKVDANGNIYLSGAGGRITLDDGKVLDGGTFLIKLNSSGQTLWGLISENTYNSTATTGGPIALANDGVYWSSTFYGRLELQGHILNTTNPNGGTPNAFVAKVSSAGLITAIYHDQSKASIPQVMVSADNGNASVLMLQGGPRHRIILDENCKVLSDLPFSNYGDFPRPVRKTDWGYEMFTNLYARNENGFYSTGFYDVKFDNNLNITDSIKLFPNKINDRNIYDAISDNKDGYYLNSPIIDFGQEFDWIYMNRDFEQTTLKPELRSFSNVDPFRRNFVKMSSDTLNMLMRHLDFYATDFVFNGQLYSTPSDDESFFWTKFVYQDPDSCKKVKVTVLQNGREGVQDVKIIFSLPKGCPASEDIFIDIALKDTASNDGDFTLPAKFAISKGTTEALLTIPVLNDNYLEKLEDFTLVLAVNATNAGYLVPVNAGFKIEDDDDTPINKVVTVSYTPEIVEGGAVGKIRISLPENVLLKQALHFSFLNQVVAHQAESNDYDKFDIVLPPHSNTAEINVKAISDYLIEGDEYISGRIVENGSIFAPFFITNDLVKIKITDIDNTEENRVVEFQAIEDKLYEGDKTDIFFKLKEPYKLQDPIKVSVSTGTMYPYIKQSSGEIIIDSLGANKQFTITYPDDHVIRTDKELTYAISASDSYPGSFKFKYNGSAVDTFTIPAIDNDITRAKMLLQPVEITIKEGGTANVNLKLPDDYVIESNTVINYAWSGLGIVEDKRIVAINSTAVLSAMQNSLQAELKVINDNVLNQYNTRQVTYKANNDNFGEMAFDASNTVNIQIEDNEIGSITVPNTFTPNGDGINDTWDIKGLPDGAKVNISVWNRGGLLIHQQSNYSPWDGTHKGSLLQTGIYYYIITSKEKIISSGSLTIVR